MNILLQKNLWQESLTILVLFMFTFFNHTVLAEDQCVLNAREINDRAFHEMGKTCSSSWGDHAIKYSKPFIPSQCDPIKWAQNRVLAVVEQLIHKKINYCHHHVFDCATPMDLRSSDSKNCSDASDLITGKNIRWNYSGTGEETEEIWQQEKKWYGFDCSNFTSWVYNYGLGIVLNSNVYKQGGQSKNSLSITPNEDGYNEKSKKNSVGHLLKYSDLGIGAEIDYSDQYVSSFDSSGQHCAGNQDKKAFPELCEKRISELVLNKLNPGDLIFLAGADKKQIFHVIMWTGKKVGQGIEDINSKLIAPNPYCPNEWQPQDGKWVIIDSHYQGPDYRVFSNCYYRRNIWGIRRIIQ